MTTTSEPAADPRLESLRLRLERLLQVTAGQFDLRFAFGDRDWLGVGELQLNADPAQVIALPYAHLKGRALHLFGHLREESHRWLPRAQQLEAAGRPHFARLWHALEDARLENRLIARWPGMAKHLDAKIPPKLGGSLLRLATPTRQIELGLYYLGRGLAGAQFSRRVARLFDQAGTLIQSACQAETAEATVAAAEALYPLAVPFLRGQMAESDELPQSHPLPSDPADDPSEPEADRSQPAPLIGLDNDLLGAGDPADVPQADRFAVGSLPWFERGLGAKQVHPSVVQSDRQTIVLPPPHDPAAYRSMLADVQGDARRLAQRLRLVYQESQYLRFGGRFRSGKLDNARLWRQRSGSYRLFQRRLEPLDRQWAVSLLIDESASMRSDARCRVAALAAVLIGEALAELEIPFEIIGFSTDQFEAEAALGLGLRPAHAYRTTRCSRLEHRLYKSYDEPYRLAARRLPGIEARHNNWDEEHLWFAFRRLQGRRAAHRMMLVVCDGQPNGDADHLIATVRQLERLGTTVIGIGIGEDFVRRAYRRAIVATDIPSLARALMEILARELGRSPTAVRGAAPAGVGLP